MIETKSKSRTGKFTEQDVNAWRETMHKAIDKIQQPEDTQEVNYNFNVIFIREGKPLWEQK